MSESTLRYEVRCCSLNHSVANISGINSIRRRTLRLEMRRNVPLVPSFVPNWLRKSSSRTATVQMDLGWVSGFTRSYRNFITFTKPICRAFFKLKFNLSDIAIFGYVLMCMASACRLIPGWISKVGAIGILIAPLITIACLWNFDRHEG